jgi:hypothetical protein
MKVRKSLVCANIAGLIINATIAWLLAKQSSVLLDTLIGIGIFARVVYISWIANRRPGQRRSTVSYETERMRQP